MKKKQRKIHAWQLYPKEKDKLNNMLVRMRTWNIDSLQKDKTNALFR